MINEDTMIKMAMSTSHSPSKVYPVGDNTTTLRKNSCWLRKKKAASTKAILRRCFVKLKEKRRPSHFCLPKKKSRKWRKKKGDLSCFNDSSACNLPLRCRDVETAVSV